MIKNVKNKKKTCRHDYKKFKNLKKQNLRDNMTNLELVLNMLAEASTAEISKKKKPEGLPANQQIALEGGHVAGKARAEIEKQTGESVITGARPYALPSKRVRQISGKKK